MKNEPHETAERRTAALEALLLDAAGSISPERISSYSLNVVQARVNESVDMNARLNNERAEETNRIRARTGTEDCWSEPARIMSRLGVTCIYQYGTQSRAGGTVPDGSEKDETLDRAAGGQPTRGPGQAINRTAIREKRRQKWEHLQRSTQNSSL